MIGAVLLERDPRALAHAAARLEELDFSTVNIGDHLHRRGVGTLTACAVIAQATSRARFGPLVLNNDFRHPAVLAREAGYIAEMSDGRFDLGLGAGWATQEYERIGVGFDAARVRIARMAEAAQILRGLLAGDTVTFEGEHYSVQGESMPKPPRVPLLIGGNSRATHAAAAAHGDIVGLIGFDPNGVWADFTTDALERQVARLREMAGARFDELEIQVLVQWHALTNDRRAAAEQAAEKLDVAPEVVLDSPYVLIGTAEQIAEQVLEHNRRFGITRWTIFGDRSDLPSAEEFVPVLELLAHVN